jgi:hypothetical protein
MFLTSLFSFPPFLTSSFSLSSAISTNHHHHLSGVTNAEMNDLSDQFEYMKVMHSWFRDREAKSYEMPASQEEAQQMLQSDIESGRLGIETYRKLNRKSVAKQEKMVKEYKANFTKMRG